MAEHKPLQGTLIENDEELGYALSDLVTVSSKIMDAAATYLSKCGKRMSDDKVVITPTQLRVLGKTCDLAQRVVKIGAELNLMLRKPYQWFEEENKRQQEADAEPSDAPLLEESDMVESEIVDEDIQ